MRLITREIDYAIRALWFMARHNHARPGHNGNGQVMTVFDLAGKLKAPRPFLRKILQTLNKQGVLSSSKGTGGGFRLARSPEEISLNDLVKIFHGPTKLHQCVFNKKICPDIRSCILKKKIEIIENHITDELESITLKTLLPAR